MKEGLDSDQKGFNGDLPQPIEISPLVVDFASSYEFLWIPSE